MIALGGGALGGKRVLGVGPPRVRSAPLEESPPASPPVHCVFLLKTRQVGGHPQPGRPLPRPSPGRLLDLGPPEPRKVHFCPWWAALSPALHHGSQTRSVPLRSRSKPRCPCAPPPDAALGVPSWNKARKDESAYLPERGRRSCPSVPAEYPAKSTRAT